LAACLGLPFQLAVRNAVPGAQGVAVLGKQESALFLPFFGVTALPSAPLVVLPFTFDAHSFSSCHEPLPGICCGRGHRHRQLRDN